MQRIKRGRALIALMLLMILAVTGTSIPVDGTAAQHTVTHYGLAGDGNNVAGIYRIGGKPAFCCDHLKDSLPTGTKVTMSIGRDADVAKVLYYGYGGPEEWSGFPDDDEAVLATSLALDHYFNGGTWDSSPVYTSFMKFLSSKGSEDSGTSYILYTSDKSSYQRLASVNPPVKVNVTVTKESADRTFTENNSCYSLQGAQYGVYSGSKLLMTIVTGADGKASGTVTVSPEEAGKLTVKEIKPSKGYAKDDEVYSVDGSSGSVSVISQEPPAANPVEMLLYKYDGETEGKDDKYFPQKGASLEGAVFKVDFYDMDKSQMPADGDYSGKRPLRTWYFVSDPQGKIKWDEAYFAEGYEQSALYSDPNGGGGTALPLGVVTVREIKAPEGYLLNEMVYACAITQDGEKAVCDAYQIQRVPDEIKRGDLELVKIADGSARRMAGIPFMITSMQENGKDVNDGESHIIVTDENGYFSTAASFNSHSGDTNANDAAWDGKRIDESKLDATAGIWFGEKDDAGNDRGALPYGKYRIDELACSHNEGYKLLKGIEIYVTRDGHVIELGTLTNDEINLETELWDSAMDQKGSTLARKDITLTDRVTYSGLETGAEYTLKGVLMDKESKKPLVIDGNQIRGEKVFTAAGTDGNVDVEFTFDASQLRGKEIVAFETLVKDGAVIAKHEDIDDEAQTIGFLNPIVETTAANGDGSGKALAAGKGATVTDEVNYSGLLSGQTYDVTGVLMDKGTGKPLIVDGKEVTAAETFAADEGSGNVRMTFSFDATGLEGRQLVVFETIKWNGKVVAEHKDINDENQTVYVNEPGVLIPGTGDAARMLLPALLLMTAACAAAVAIFLRTDSNMEGKR